MKHESIFLLVSAFIFFPLTRRSLKLQSFSSLDAVKASFCFVSVSNTTFSLVSIFSY